MKFDTGLSLHVLEATYYLFKNILYLVTLD